MSDELHVPPTDEMLEVMAADRSDQIGTYAFEIITLRKALRECGEKLAVRDQKITELREIIHAGQALAGVKHASTKKHNRRPPQHPPR